MKLRNAVLVLSGLVLNLSFTGFGDNTAAGLADHWHQWRGPSGNGVAPNANPPVMWGPSENIQWKIAIPGHGSSSPVVWGDRVFILSAEKVGGEKTESAPPAEQPERRGRRRGGPGGGRDRAAPTETFRFLVHCLDRATGKSIWQKTAIEAIPHEGHHNHHGYASPSPVTDGKRLIASFGSRGIFGYDMEGKKLWERDLGDMITRNGFGEGSSPALYNGVVFIQWDNETDSKFFALSADTGEILWKVDRDEPTAWATPFVVEHAGVTQVIANADKKVRSYDSKNGNLIWSSEGQTGNVIPSPVVAGGVVFCMSGFRGSMLQAIKLDAKGDLAAGDPSIVWTHDKGTPYVPSPLLYDNLLYFFSVNKGILTVMDVRTGKPVLESKRLEGIGDIYASPVGAAGRVYIVDRNGAILVMEHGTEAKTLALNEMDEPIDASPALAGNQIFLRGTSHLYCVAEGKK